MCVVMLLIVKRCRIDERFNTERMQRANLNVVDTVYWHCVFSSSVVFFLWKIIPQL